MNYLNTNLLSLCDLNITSNVIGAHIASYVEDSENRTVLLNCVEQQSYIACENILNHIGYIEDDLDYQDIFITACQHNDIKILKLLINHVSSLDTIYEPLYEYDKSRMNLICYASLYGNPEACKELIEYFDCPIEGYETHNEEWDYEGEELIESWYGNLGVTPLVNAVYSGNLKLVRLLLKNGAKVNNCARCTFHLGNKKHEMITALGMAVTQNQFKIAKLLLSFGADPDIVHEKYIQHEFYTETKKSLSPLTLVLDDINNRIRFLKLFKIHTNVITHEQYIKIRNKLRKNNKIEIVAFKAMDDQKKIINRFRITEVIKTTI